MKRKLFITVIICTLLTLLAAACGKEDAGPVLDCPFTSAGWDASADDAAAAEGLSIEEASSYDSVYGGLCYTYPKEYNGLQGTIKYMFDKDGRLMCAAWAYGCDDAEELSALYESINDSVNEIHGESGYAADHPGNYGNVWYLDTGDIVLTTMITEETKALQYAYLHPLVSNKDE